MTFPSIPPNYARLLVQGWDTYQEAFFVALDPAVTDELEVFKTKAKEQTGMGGVGLSIPLGDEEFQIWSSAPRGARWALEGEDFLIIIRAPKMACPVSVRYSALALWKYDIADLRCRAIEAVKRLGELADPEPRVSRADWAFDFHSPAFSEEITYDIPNYIVAHSSVKKRATKSQIEVVGSLRPQTLTIGSKAGMQIQLYNKAQQISDVRGTDWIAALWAAAGYEFEGKPKDIWRLEVRMGPQFLKDRNVRLYETLKASAWRLLAEALATRRLTRPIKQDKHKDRWPIHPLWAMALQQFDLDGMLPVGRFVSGQRKALHRQGVAQVAGSVRSLMILTQGECSRVEVDNLIAEIREKLETDPRHSSKMKVAKERYKFVKDDD